MLPDLLSHGGSMMWLLLVAGAVAVAVFIERLLHYHREQINTLDFINGVRNVLKRDNVVEAISICDATPGPVARLVKTAILNRERGREGVREALEDAGLVEVPRLEEKLALLATIGQIAPIMGLLGTVLGFPRPPNPGFVRAGHTAGRRRLAGARLHRGGFGGGHPLLRRLQLPRQPGQRNRRRHGESVVRDCQPPDRSSEALNARLRHAAPRAVAAASGP